MSVWMNDWNLLTKRMSFVYLDQLLCENTKCTKNSTTKPTLWRDDNKNDFMLLLKCEVCNIEWRVCTTCHLKKKLLKNDQVRMHRYKYHNTNITTMNKKENYNSTKRSGCKFRRFTN
jgi:hypothetical protein